MDHRPDTVDEATRAALPRPGKRDAWLEQRLHFLIGEQARLKGGVPLEALVARCQGRLPPLPALTADPAHRFHCGATLHAVEPRGWINSSTGKLVMKLPDPHRAARTLDRPLAAVWATTLAGPVSACNPRGAPTGVWALGLASGSGENRTSIGFTPNPEAGWFTRPLSKRRFERGR